MPRRESEVLGALLQLSSRDLDDTEISRLLTLFKDIPDLHLRAALHHRLNQLDAGELYVAALDAYEKEAASAAEDDKAFSGRGLQRLCYADYARYLLDTGFTIPARINLNKALEFGATESRPTLFVVDCLLLKASAEDIAGESGAANDSLTLAAKLAGELLPAGHTQLASVHDRFGWTNMSRWQLFEARKHFEMALAIRREIALPDLMTRVAMMHDEHGLAMVSRFSGDIADARTRYGRLVGEVKSLVAEAQSRYETELVYGRLVNTLERLADCYLFSTPPQPEDAYGRIEEAVSLCESMSPQSKFRTRARLRCKQAMVLALAGESQGATDVIARMKKQDYQNLVGQQVHEIDLYRQVAEGLVKLNEKATEGQAELSSLLTLNSSGTGVAASRQQWEVMLFAGDQLLRSYKSADMKAAIGDADRLVDLASKSLNSSNLPYLRPYFNAALRVQLPGANGLKIRSVARNVQKAKTGDPLCELPRNTSVVVFFLNEHDGYAIVLPGNGAANVKSTTESLSFGLSNYAQAKLPESLLAVVKQLPDCSVYWADSGVNPALTNDDFPFESAADWGLVLPTP